MANQRTQLFRQMLAKLAHVIKKRELDSMKYMCIDVIPRAVLEDMDNAVDLWMALEERDVISSDNIEFLDNLLTNACAGRVDILQELRHYKSVSSGMVDDTEDLSREFDLVSKQLGRQWRPLARKLGISEAEIDSLSQTHSRDLQELIRQCLLQWQRSHKRNATKDKLISALKSCQLNLLAYDVQDVDNTTSVG